MWIVLSEEEVEEYKKFPAKKYVGIPWHGVVEESLPALMMAAIKDLRDHSLKWSESEEATALAREIEEVENQLESKREALRKRHDAVTAELSQRVRDISADNR